MELSAEGYAIYFMILEVLREEKSFCYPMDDIDVLANDFGVSEQKVRTVVSNYNLFKTKDHDKLFYSPKLIEFMQPYLKMREQRRLAGIKSGEKRQKERPFNDRSTTVQRVLNENEQSKVKESKVKESKYNTRFVKPSVSEIRKYCESRKNIVDADTFFDFYESKGWLVGKSKMKDWKAAVRTWERNSDNQSSEEKRKKIIEELFDDD